MKRRDLLAIAAALPLCTWAVGKAAPRIYADGRYIPVLQANKENLLIVLAEPLRGHTVFKADRQWDDQLDKVNLTPYG